MPGACTADDGASGWESQLCDAPNWDWNYTDEIFYRDTPSAGFQ